MKYIIKYGWKAYNKKVLEEFIIEERK